MKFVRKYDMHYNDGSCDFIIFSSYNLRDLCVACWFDNQVRSEMLLCTLTDAFTERRQHSAWKQEMSRY